MIVAPGRLSGGGLLAERKAKAAAGLLKVRESVFSNSSGSVISEPPSGSRRGSEIEFILRRISSW